MVVRCLNICALEMGPEIMRGFEVVTRGDVVVIGGKKLGVIDERIGDEEVVVASHGKQGEEWRPDGKKEEDAGSV
ncbi:hypothetical protein Lal_00048540 [Lupinus albus]|nr:hypothetical protein Lal_00048540 [Lupinus albus]